MNPPLRKQRGIIPAPYRMQSNICGHCTCLSLANFASAALYTDRCCWQEPVVPMSFLRAKPIGVMPMIDQGEQDDKIIAVHADDPEFRGFSDISELPKHRLMEIKR